MIIGITGMPGAGKTMVADFLKDERGFMILEMHDVILDQMKEKGIEINNVSVREYAAKIRVDYGMDAVAKFMVDKVKKAVKTHPDVAITGVRSTNEIECFRKNIGKALQVIAITAPSDLRFNRLKHRGREDDLKTKDEFEYREEKEKGYGIPGAVEGADYVIMNTGTLEELKENLIQVLDLIKKQDH